MSNIKEVEFGRPEVDDGMVAAVEELLERIKEGKVESLCFVHLDRDMRVWAFMSETDNWLEQVGMVHVLKSDVETKSTRQAVRDLGGDA